MAGLTTYISGSPHLRAAGYAVMISFAGSMLFWFIGRRTSNDTWSYVSLDLFIFAYFYSKWSAQNAQHKTLYFILMCAYGLSASFIAFQLAMKYVLHQENAHAYFIAFWVWNLVSNIVFAFALAFLTIYSLLKRRARKDPKKWRDSVDAWFGEEEKS